MKFISVLKKYSELKIIYRVLIDVALALLLACAPFVISHFSSAGAESAVYYVYGVIASIILAVILIVLLVLGPSYHKSMTQIPVDFKNYVWEAKQHHITILNHTLHLLIKKNDDGSGLDAEITEIKKIYNNQTKTKYENHTYSMYSSQGNADPKDVECFRDGELIEITDDRKTVTSFKSKTDSTKRNGYGVQITIPINIPRKECVELKIHEKCSRSFTTTLQDLVPKKKGEYVSDWISSMIYYPTEVFRIVVELDQSVLSEYSLTKLANYTFYVNGNPILQQTTENMFMVVDQSDQQIVNYENMLKECRAVPELSKNGKTAVWELHNPKIGYKFIQHFTIKKL